MAGTGEIVRARSPKRVKFADRMRINSKEYGIVQVDGTWDDDVEEPVW